MVKYYLDTCIWIDLLEDRKGPKDEHFGEFAFRLLSLIKLQGHKVIISDHLIQEIKSRFWMESIQIVFGRLGGSIERVSHNIDQASEARQVRKNVRVPYGDVLHAILARDCSAILVTRDKHFKKLADIAIAFRPEELF